MGTLLLLQIGLDLGLIAIITVLLLERSKAKNSDDPRLSRGLQMLSSKIAIIEDLMDRSETSGKQMTQLLEAKQQDVHETLEEVERQLHRVYDSIEKSKNIARLFEDKIPHEEIIERQNAAKYLTAAKLANQGQTVDEIARQCDIPRGELDLIVKLNRQGLMPQNETAWIENSASTSSSPNTNSNTETRAEEFQFQTSPLVETYNSATVISQVITQPNSPTQGIIISKPSAPIAVTPAAPVSKTTIYSTRYGKHEQDSPSIRPVVFKRITMDSKQ